MFRTLPEDTCIKYQESLLRSVPRKIPQQYFYFLIQENTLNREKEFPENTFKEEI